MTDYLIPLLALLGAIASWYCYRWGHDDGRAEGYDEGRQKGLLEGADARVQASRASGGGGEPIEPA
jgi:hypothetical protein